MSLVPCFWLLGSLTHEVSELLSENQNAGYVVFGRGSEHLKLGFLVLRFRIRHHHFRHLVLELGS